MRKPQSILRDIQRLHERHHVLFMAPDTEEPNKWMKMDTIGRKIIALWDAFHHHPEVTSGMYAGPRW